MVEGGCHCGSIRYKINLSEASHGLCHCTDCRRAVGAPAVSWAMVKRDQITISGQPASYASSPDADRHFCSQCGTSLFYVNEAILPGMVDVLSATLDTPEVLPLQAQIQTAERLSWMEHLDRLPAFERFPRPSGGSSG